MLPTLRVNRTRCRWPRRRRSPPALPLNSSVSCRPGPRPCRCRRPDPTGTRRRRRPGSDVVALLAVDEVVAVAAEQQVGAVAAEDRVVAGAAVDGDLISAARLPVAEKLSLPPFMLTTRFSLVPMSSANGAGSRRSKRTRVPLAVVVKTSAPLPPLTSTVSMPRRPRSGRCRRRGSRSSGRCRTRRRPGRRRRRR
jgi:hypothetical protein